MIGKIYNGTSVTDIPIAASASQGINSGLGIFPGNYLINGIPYEVQAPGLHRWFNSSTGVFQQRVCWTGDIMAFISGCAWFHAHGTQDDGRSVSVLGDVARNYKLRLTCGYITDFMVWLLPQVGYQCRRAQLLTGETPNGYDDGHVPMEVKIGGFWRLIDMTNNCYWTNQGNHLSLAQLIDLGIANATKVMLSADKPNSFDIAGGFDHGLYYETVLPTDVEQDAWKLRMYQIPGVLSGGIIYVYLPAGLESRQSYVQSRGCTVMTKAAWTAAFYPV